MKLLFRNSNGELDKFDINSNMEFNVEQGEQFYVTGAQNYDMQLVDNGTSILLILINEDGEVFRVTLNNLASLINENDPNDPMLLQTVLGISTSNEIDMQVEELLLKEQFVSGDIIEELKSILSQELEVNDNSKENVFLDDFAELSNTFEATAADAQSVEFVSFKDDEVVVNDEIKYGQVEREFIQSESTQKDEAERLTENKESATVSLSATPSLNEAGGVITYTATLTLPSVGETRFTLSNGEVIVIAAGQTSGTVSVNVEANEDVYRDESSISAQIVSATKGGFEQVTIDPSSATTQIKDTIDSTTVTLTTNDVGEDDISVTFTATLSNPGQTDVILTTEHGDIVIPAGETSGTITIETQDSDVYIDPTQVSASILSATGGNFENLIDTANATANIYDDVDITNLALSTSNVDEDNGIVTFTASLSNAGQTDVTVTTEHGDIVIPAGQTTGSLTVDMTDSDVYVDATSISATVSNVVGGNFEALDYSTATATAEISDTIDTTTVDLSVQDVTEDDESVTFTVQMSNPPQEGSETIVTIDVDGTSYDVTVDPNGTGTLTINTQDSDVYNDASTLSASVTGVSGGNYEAVDFSSASAIATISDTIDDTTVAISTSNITEDDTSVTFDIQLSNPPQSGTQAIVTVDVNGTSYDVTVDASGAGTLTINNLDNSDVYNDSGSYVATVTGVSGGNFENVIAGQTTTSNVLETIDDTTVSLSATSDITEAGGTITYTATLTNPSQGETVVELENGQTITIADGQTIGTVDVEVTANEDVYNDATTISTNIVSATGGNFENLIVDNSTVTTNINDTVDTTTVSLSTSNVDEDNGVVTFTATLSNAGQTQVTITTEHGDIVIPAGQTSGSLTVDMTDSDVYVDATSVSATVSNVVGGNFEAVDYSLATATAEISDTVDTTTVNLSTTDVNEDDASITFIATLTNPSQGETTIVTTQGTITIANGQTSGTLTIDTQDSDVYNDADSLSATITSATGGNFENLVIGTDTATAQIADTIDTTTVSLSTSDVNEDNGVVTFTATLSNAGQSDVTITTEHGDIVIPAGQTSGTLTVDMTDSDVYLDATSVSATVSNVVGGNFEAVDYSNATATAQVTDTVDTTTVSLATSDVDEDNGVVTFTATLSNAGQSDVTITTEHGDIVIPAGQTSGTLTVDMTDSDVYLDATSVSATVSNVVGGNFEAVDYSNATATAQVTDTVDTTTVSLATSDVDEDNGVVTFTATLSNAGQSDVTITTEHGDIVIAAGETSGTLTVDMTDSDVYVDATSVSATVSNVVGGNFEAVDYSNASATAQVADTVDTTTVSLSATDAITEAGGVITYTATLTNPSQGETVVTLANGETITIGDGQTVGTVDITIDSTDDVYEDVVLDETQISTNIVSATGGNFENLVVDTATVTTAVNDTIDTTTVSLSGTSDISEAGGTITYTATLTNPSQGETVVNLANGETITIADGQTTGTVDIVVEGSDDVYVDASLTSTSITSASGGNFENLEVDSSVVNTNITDTIDTTTATLSATTALTEAGGTITYTVTLTNPSQGDTTITLENGEVITIGDGQTVGTIDVAVAANEDVYQDASVVSNSIASATGGNFENLVANTTTVSTNINDTVDATTVTLSTNDVSEDDTSVTFTATLSNAGQTDVVLTTEHGTITIPAGETSGTITVETQDSDVYNDPSEVSASILSATGGNFENLIDSANATAVIYDDVDTTMVDLSVEDVNEDAQSVTFNISISNPPQAGSECTVTVDVEGTSYDVIIDANGTGTLTINTQDSDVYNDASTMSASVTAVNGGNYEAVNFASANAVATINDSIDDTTVSITTSDVTEDEASVTFDIQLSNPPQNGTTAVVTVDVDGTSYDVTVDANGAGSLVIGTQDSDGYIDASTVTATVTAVNGGNYENVVTGQSVVANVTDTINDTTVSLSATNSITEAGGTVTYTATLTAPSQGDTIITLSNGETITISDGNTIGTVDVVVAADEDVYNDASTISATITNASGGNFENLVIDSAAATTNITDTITYVTVDLSTSDTLTEAGGTITYTATLSHASQGETVVTLDNGQTITIADGATTGTVDRVVAGNDNAYTGGMPAVTAVVTDVSGGNFENVDYSGATSFVPVDDTLTVTTLSLTTSDVNEDDESVTFTASVDNPPQTDLIITTNQGDITILAGQTTGTLTISTQDSDVYSDASSITATVSSTSGGNFELLDTLGATATAQIADTIQDTTVSLSATSDITEAGGTVTYTATLTNPSQGDTTVTLANGSTITIADGQTTGTVDVVVAANEDVYNDASTISTNIVSASGGNFENLVVDNSTVTTNVNDTTSNVTVTLNSVSVEFGTTSATITASLSHTPETEMKVTLNNGATITFGTDYVPGTDVESIPFDISDTTNLSISSTLGGNFENVVTSDTATVTVMEEDLVVLDLTDPDNGIGTTERNVDIDDNGIINLEGNGYISVDNSDEINKGVHDERTINVWFNTTDDSNGKHELFFEGGGTRSLQIYIKNDVLTIEGYNKPRNENDWQPTKIEYPIDVTDGEWHMATLVLDGPRNSTEPDGMKMYVDGTHVGSAEGGAIWNHAKAVIGRNFDGELADVKIINDVKTDQEIADMFLNPPEGVTPVEPVVEVEEVFEDGTDGGWGENASVENGQLVTEKDETISKDFDFGLVNAGKTVEIKFDVTFEGGWETSGSYQDYFMVRANGDEILNISEDDGTYPQSMMVTLDENGQVSIDVEVNSSGSGENAYISNFAIVEAPDNTQLTGSISNEVVNVLFSDTDNFSGNNNNGWSSDGGATIYSNQLSIGYGASHEYSTKEFSFGAENANQAVTITMNVAGSGWDSNDSFSILNNATGESLFASADGSSREISFTGMTDANGNLDLKIDVQAPGNSDRMSFDNITIVGGEYTYDLDIANAGADSGNETLGDVTIANLPEGSSLSAGTNNGDGTWTVTQDDIDGLKIESDRAITDMGEIQLAVTATNDAGDQETTFTTYDDTIDLSDVAVNNVDVVELTNNEDQTVNIDLQDVIDMTDEDNDLVFIGDDGDVIDFNDSAEWTESAGTTTVDGVDGDFKEYVSNSNPSVSVFVEDDITTDL